MSIKKARGEEGDRNAKKFVNPGALGKVPAESMTFTELADWYLEQKSIKKLCPYRRINGILGSFNEIFGSRIVSSIKLQDLEEYQEKREEGGRAAATIDMESALPKPWSQRLSTTTWRTVGRSRHSGWSRGN